MFGHLLTDLLTALSTLSQQLQRDDAGLFHSHEQVQASIMTVKKYKERAGPNLRIVLEKDTFRGFPLNGALKTFDNARVKMVDGLVACLEKRFADIDTGLLEGTKLADFTTWPSEFNDDTKSFGDDYIAVLTDHFRATLRRQLVDTDLIEIEWDVLRTKLYNNHAPVQALTWKTVNELLGKECPNLLALMDLILALPAATAMCERGFSVMKETKTAYRNRLKTKTLSNLMMVKLHSKNEKEFDPGPAIHYWNQNGTKSRRFNFMERVIDGLGENIDQNNNEPDQEPAEVQGDDQGQSNDENVGDTAGHVSACDDLGFD